MPRICVLGAGIMGVSTALAIQERIPNSEVTIIAEKFSPNTTSDVAAGLIEPYLCDDDVDRIINWTKSTIHRIQEYMSDGNPGAEEQSGYWLQSVKSVPKWLEIMKNVKILNENEMKLVAKRPEHNDTTITLGGTADRNQWDRTIDPEISERIFEENCKNIPSLRSAQIISSHVDLRPSRATVRLEAEPNSKIIHNYGHGGSGITLHWGCALECVELVKQVLAGKPGISKI